MSDLTEEIELLTRALDIKAEDFSQWLGRQVTGSDLIRAASSSDQSVTIPTDSKLVESLTKQNHKLKKDLEDLKMVRELNNKELVELE